MIKLRHRREGGRRVSHGWWERRSSLNVDYIIQRVARPGGAVGVGEAALGSGRVVGMWWRTAGSDRRGVHPAGKGAGGAGLWDLAVGTNGLTSHKLDGALSPPLSAACHR
jgi:hypothetical protein